jgi:hypothetical protein
MSMGGTRFAAPVGGLPLTSAASGRAKFEWLADDDRLMLRVCQVIR